MQGTLFYSEVQRDVFMMNSATKLRSRLENYLQDKECTCPAREVQDA